jgi:type VI protein secretion system component VasK
MSSSLPFGLETREAVAYGLIGLLLALCSVWLLAHRRKMKHRRARLSGSAESKRDELIRRR